MKIGIDLDGTLYQHPVFFCELIRGMTKLGHKFLCISSHARSEWDANDKKQFEYIGALDVWEMIDPSPMNHKRHGSLEIKGKACNQCDFVFDDDIRLTKYTAAFCFCVFPTNFD